MNPSIVMDRLRSWFVLIPLLLLLGAIYWLSQQVELLPVKPDNSMRHDPDFMINQFTATTLNVQGKPQYVMSARKLIHYPDDNSTHVEAPALSSFEPDKPPLHIYADKGMMSGKGDEVFLHENVKIVRAASTDQSEMTFTTSYLHVIPDLGLAETDQPVMLVDERNIVRAIGMKFDSKAHIVKLLAQVRSQHVPKNP